MKFDHKRISPWVHSQLALGHSREELLWGLVLNEGFSIPMADRLLDACINWSGNDGVLFRQLPEDRIAVPEPVFTEVGTHEFEGRALRLTLANFKPHVALFEGFASDDECDTLMAEALPQMQRSVVVTAGTDEVHDSRTSSSAVYEQESALTQTLRRRISALVQWPHSHIGRTQVTRYQGGEQFEPHQDFLDENACEHSVDAAQLKVAGNRLATALIYLQAPRKGGATYFANIGLEVAARRGALLFFNYPVRNASSMCLHAGNPVLEGEKWVSTHLLYERAMPAKPLAA